MRAHALCEKNSAPTHDQINNELRAHLCRCTGYTKIVEAIELLASVRRGEPIPENSCKGGVGDRLPKYVGRESALYAENNYIQPAPANDASTIIAKWGGVAMTEIGTRVNGKKVSALGAYNAANPTDTIGDDAGWVPQYRPKVDPTMSVPAQVELRAGAGTLR